jgi:hypothetical protein
MVLDPKVWGPHYWFFIHTISMSYPLRPNSITKKKYYEFIQNIPLFIPVESIAGDFSKLLDQYPVSPYLDSRDAFIRWVWFIHNKVNEKLEKNKISLNKFYELYYEEYKPKDIKNRELNRLKNKFVYLFILVIFITIIVYFYNK